VGVGLLDADITSTARTVFAREHAVIY